MYLLDKLLSRGDVLLIYLSQAFMLIVFFIISLILLSRKCEINAMIFLKDHCKIYRKIKGGRWGYHEGYWGMEEKLLSQDIDFHGICFERKYKGLCSADNSRMWGYVKIIHYDSPMITKREDYTK